MFLATHAFLQRERRCHAQIFIQLTATLKVYYAECFVFFFFNTFFACSLSDYASPYRVFRVT